MLTEKQAEEILRALNALPPEKVAEAHDFILSLQKKNSKSKAVVDSNASSDISLLLEKCAVDTGIDDLAHQHDHYLYGKAKRD